MTSRTRNAEGHWEMAGQVFFQPDRPKPLPEMRNRCQPGADTLRGSPGGPAAVATRTKEVQVDNRRHGKDERTVPDYQRHVQQLRREGSILETADTRVGGQPAREQLEEGCGNIAWLNPTMEAIMGLPWEEKNLPDDRQPPEPRAAAQLLWAMVDILEADTTPPTSIVPTSTGGVTAEWHVNGYDLDIVCDPDGSVLFYFLDPNGNEYEGPGEDSTQEIRNFVHSLPSKRD